MHSFYVEIAEKMHETSAYLYSLAKIKLTHSSHLKKLLVALALRLVHSCIPWGFLNFSSVVLCFCFVLFWWIFFLCVDILCAIQFYQHYE